MADGKADVVGVAGRTLTLLCGDRSRKFAPPVGEAREVVVEDVEEALE